MILVDANEERNQPEMLALLRQSVEVQVASVNQTAGNPIIYPDFSFFGGPKLIGVNRKTVGELQNPDKVLEQIQKELAGPVEQLILLCEGIMVPDGQSGTWAYSLDFGNAHLFPNTDQRGTLTFRRQHSRTNWEHVQNTLTRLEWIGVQVVYSYSTLDTASKLVALHKLAMSGEPNRVLDKLIKTDVAVLALDPEETAMARMLMSVPGAKFGEELALTVAGLGYRTVGDLFRMWNSGGQLCDTMLRSGNRRIGNAAELRLQQALGFTPRSTNPELQGQSRAEGTLSST